MTASEGFRVTRKNNSFYNRVKENKDGKKNCQYNDRWKIVGCGGREYYPPGCP
jgi:hypothetical protein